MTVHIFQYNFINHSNQGCQQIIDYFEVMLSYFDTYVEILQIEIDNAV